MAATKKKTSKAPAGSTGAEALLGASKSARQDELAELKRQFAELKRQSDQIAVGMEIAAQNIALCARQRALLAERIARDETDPSERVAWEKRRDKARTFVRASAGALALAQVLSLTLVTERAGMGFQAAQEALDAEKRREWLLSCAGVLKLVKAGMSEHNGVHVREILARVDPSATKLTDEDVASAMIKGSASRAGLDAGTVAAVRPERFAARLAAKCGALGGGTEEEVFEALRAAMRKAPEQLKKRLAL